MAYMAMVKQEIAHRGWPDMGDTTIISNQWRPSWDVVNPSWIAREGSSGPKN